MSVKKRLKEFISRKKLTVTAFEISINASNGYVNSISKSIGLDKLEKILELYPELNLVWLLTGRGEMEEKHGQIQEPMSLYGNNETISALKEVINSQKKTITILEKALIEAKK